MSHRCTPLIEFHAQCKSLESKRVQLVMQDPQFLGDCEQCSSFNGHQVEQVQAALHSSDPIGEVMNHSH